MHVSGEINWDPGEHTGFDPYGEFDVTYRGIRIGGGTLQEDEDISFNYQIPQSAATSTDGQSNTTLSDCLQIYHTRRSG